MKVIAINGSPHKNGNTSQTLQLVLDELQKQGIEAEMIHVGDKHLYGCIACGGCKTKVGACSLGEDGLNDAIEKVREADGIILGSPVHFSGITGAMKCFCDRLAYVAGSDPSIMYHKVGAAVIAVRRTGGSSALDCLMHYLTYHEMIIASSNYWNIIHGRIPGEVAQDEEGVQIMRILGKNMAWLLNLREQGLLQAPEKEPKILTNFVR